MILLRYEKIESLSEDIILLNFGQPFAAACTDKL